MPDPHPPALPPDARILLVRLSAIGDVVFASPLVAALRRACPQAHIAWLVQPECRALLDHHPDLDEVIVCPMGHWRRLWRRRRFIALGRGLRALRETLHAQRFDLALDLQGLGKSGLLTRLSGARERIGLGSREGSAWLMTRTIARGGEARRIGSEYLYLAQALGLPTDPFEMVVHYDGAAGRSADATLVREGLTSGFALLCPFTTRPQKHWFEDRWADLAIRLRRELGLTPVLLGGPRDRAAADRINDGAAAGGTDGGLGGIRDATRPPLVNLVGQTSLTEAAALIERAALVVAVDTGLGHMGIAAGTPSVLLFGSTCPYLETTRANARVLYHRQPCSPCRRRPTCNADFTCMKALGVGEVLAAAQAVLGTAP
ncbi:glycosyltransferase family 9 protein [uncultured Thiodictyon sp.]|jgi:heptosyltransferase-1|uniref:glycosyltransferase family 9 protein n=1 Tax=uncultured Thiodictyon sp. TaxID=1846217 RepID=UPI0025FF05E1|nr:glycosyltransferase family 9 protein [uncultured Thiodictyon sp.]